MNEFVVLLLSVQATLLLRGPQSAGEIRQRTDRLHTFSSLDEVEETLTWFIEYPHGPIVRRIPVGEGRRVETFDHLLSPAAADSASSSVTLPQPPTPLRKTIGVPPSKRDSQVSNPRSPGSNLPKRREKSHENPRTGPHSRTMSGGSCGVGDELN